MGCLQKFMDIFVYVEFLSTKTKLNGILKSIHIIS